MRMGAVNMETATAGDAETTFDSRIRISFSGTGETDGGLSFGGSIRADNAAAGAAGTGGSVFVSGAFGKLTMGDITAAHKAATGNVAGVGYVGIGDKNEVGYLAGADEGLAYSYTIDGLTLNLSTSQRAADGATGAAAELDAVGIGYKFGDYSVAVGYGEQGTSEQTTLSARASIMGISLALVSLDNNRPATVAATDIDAELAMSVSYAVNDALSLTAFTKEVDYFDTATADRRYTGFGGSYKLGGGATLSAGYVDGAGALKQNDGWDIGVNFSF